jgi:hypothetical protein
MVQGGLWTKETPLKPLNTRRRRHVVVAGRLDEQRAQIVAQRGLEQRDLLVEVAGGGDLPGADHACRVARRAIQHGLGEQRQPQLDDGEYELEERRRHERKFDGDAPLSSRRNFLGILIGLVGTAADAVIMTTGWSGSLMRTVTWLP